MPELYKRTADVVVDRFVRACLETHIRIQIECNKTKHTITEIEEAAGIPVKQMLDESIESIIPCANWDAFFKIVGYYMDKSVLYKLSPGRYTYSPTPSEGLDNEAFLGWLRGLYVAVCDDNYNIMKTEWVVIMANEVGE